MQDEQPARVAGPITTPKAFRRMTGAHSLIVQIILADLAGFLMWIAIGALIGPPTWWIIRALLHLFHASLILDLGLIAIALCGGIGRFRRRWLEKRVDDAWAIPGTLLFFLIAGLLVIWLLKPDWMAIPAHVLPDMAVEALSWRLVFLPQGAALAAILSLLAHLLIVRWTKHDPANEHLTLSRTHPDGAIARFMEQVYAVYRRDLNRFQPPPLSRLKTPAAFYYYQRDPDATGPRSPEQDIYWRGGNLIINRALIGPKPEQANILLPLLARQLYDNNTPDHLVTFLFSLAHTAERSWFTAWMLTVPLYVAEKCERHWDAQERDRQIDRDWFAYLCGQGRRLRKLLRQQLEDRTQRHLPDNAIPTLAERLDYLDGILAREDRQVQQLRDALPPASPEQDDPSPDPDAPAP